MTGVQTCALPICPAAQPAMQRRPAAQPAMQGRPAAPGEADQRVREDLERMREFLRRQQETEGE